MESPTGQDSPGTGQERGPAGLIEPVKREARELADHAAHSAQTLADESKNAAADYVWALAAAARSGADELSQRQHGRSAAMVRRAAEECTTLARTLNEHGPKDAISNIADFASRHPMLFLGAAVLMGAGVVQLINHYDESGR